MIKSLAFGNIFLTDISKRILREGPIKCLLHVHTEFWGHALCTTQSAYAAEQCIIKSVKCGLIAVSCHRRDISEHD